MTLLKTSSKFQGDKAPWNCRVKQEYFHLNTLLSPKTSLGGEQEDVEYHFSVSMGGYLVFSRFLVFILIHLSLKGFKYVLVYYVKILKQSPTNTTHSLFLFMSNSLSAALTISHRNNHLYISMYIYTFS